MKTIAITGGIGSGKTAVSNYLAQLGYTVVDADRMSREMTSAGGKAMPYILENFGPEFVAPDGSLDRAAMRDLVFKDPAKKKLLEEGTTKVVLEDIEKIRREREACGDKALFFDIPLLFESGSEKDCDAVWVVHADEETRILRVMARDGVGREQVLDRIKNQMSEEERCARADVVLDNSGSREELIEQVEKALAGVDEALAALV